MIEHRWWRQGIAYTVGLIIGVTLATGTTQAVERPLWEAGFGAGPVTLPDYRGSDEQRTFVIPVPYLVYRGDRLKLDRSGARSVLLEHKRLELDLSFAGSLPVDSDDNAAREGLPDLDPAFEVGPALKLTLAKSKDFWLRLNLPVRAVVATDFTHFNHIGWIAHPALRFDGYRMLGNWDYALRAGPLFADQSYHDYFYGVKDGFANTFRSAYQAQGGYSGAGLVMGISRRLKNFWLGAFIRYDNLDDAVFEDSPLVRQRYAFYGGFGVAYAFGRSDKIVDVPDEN